MLAAILLHTNIFLMVGDMVRFLKKINIQVALSNQLICQHFGPIVQL